MPIEILLQAVPKSIDVEQLKADVISEVKDKFDAIVKIHDLHIWTFSGNQFVGTVHIKMMNYDLKNFDQVEKFNQVSHSLQPRYNFTHSVILGF